MLNPEAPEYVPVSLSTLELPLYPHAHPMTHVMASPFYTVSPSPSIPPFPCPSLLPPCIPIGIPLQTGTSCSFLPQGLQPAGGFLPLPLPLPLPSPPQPDVPSPQPLDSESRPVAIRERAQFPRVITARKHIPRPPGSCFWRGGSWARGRGRGRSSSNDGEKGTEGFGFGGGYMRKRRPNESWDLNKHGMMPLKRDEEKTTVMIKNIPYEFTRLNLMEFLDKHCMAENQKAKDQGSSEEDWHMSLSAYDFLYLPMDFGTKKNKGYAFVNFTESVAVWKFFHAFNATKWDFNDSPKIIRIVCARIQGKEALVKHFEKTCFECESDEFLPACFTPPRDGSVDEIELTTVGRRCRGRHVSSGSTLNSSVLTS